MTDAPQLKQLRQQIDEIDVVLHAELVKRAAIIDRVRGVKGKQAIYIRPGREADMLRVLMKKPQGKLPAGLIYKLWREMISAFTLQEGGMKIAVAEPSARDSLWDIARDYYGNFTPLFAVTSGEAAIRAVQKNKATIAIVPVPDAQAKKSWWPLLAAAKDLYVFAELPFAAHLQTNARGAKKAWAIARLRPEQTADDHGLLLIEADKTLTRAGIAKALREGDIGLSRVWTAKAGRKILHMIEIDRLLAPEDMFWKKLQKMLGTARLQNFGGYAVPMR